MKINLLNKIERTPDSELETASFDVIGHSHNLRSRNSDYEETKERIVKWANLNNLGAVGIGSPWDPDTAYLYMECESIKRDEYFSGRIDPQTMMLKDKVFGLIDELNEKSNGKTIFYLDNETPKNRYGHIWFVGFEYQVPAWHDYDQNHRVGFWYGDPVEDPNLTYGGNHIRRSYAEVVAKQRKAGALAVWAHPTSWWIYENNFTTNIAAELYLHLFADGYLDGMTVQGYDAFHRDYERIWFDILDRGANAPGFSEMDACFCHEGLYKSKIFANKIPAKYIKAPIKSVDDFKSYLKNGVHVMSSGATLILEVEGKNTSEIINAKPGDVLKGKLLAFPVEGEACLSTIQLLGRGGKVLAQIDGFKGGEIDFEVVVDEIGGYVVARAFGEHDDANSVRQQSIRHCALTNPMRIITSSSPVFKPLLTKLSLSAEVNSRMNGASFEIVDAADTVVYEKGVLDTEIKTFNVHPLSRIKLSLSNGEKEDIPVSMANPRVRELTDYLADGIFREKHPNVEPGEVPQDAFRLDELQKAMSELNLVL